MDNQFDIFGNTGVVAAQGALFTTRKSTMRKKHKKLVQAHNMGLIDLGEKEKVVPKKNTHVS